MTRREVLRRFPGEFEVDQERLTREQCEREIELDPPRNYYIPFDPEETTNDEVLKTLSAIRAREGSTRAGRNPDSDLLPVMCALLLNKPGWTAELLADQLGVSKTRVGELGKDGLELLGSIS